MKQYYVYIMTNNKNGVLYTGITNDLIRRVYEHRESLIAGFSKRYQTKRLVFYEVTDDVESAIRQEKKIKNWKRAWKIDLIEKTNPSWRDLYQDLI